MAISDEQKALWEVLRALNRRSEAWLRRATGLTAWRVASAKFTRLTDDNLTTLLLSQGKFGEFPEGQVVFLRPPSKDTTAVAALWCRWDHRNEAAVRSGFYLGQWSVAPSAPLQLREDESEGNLPAKALAGTIVFWGYRFESPEPKGANHKFYHVQPCRSLGKKDDPMAHALPFSDRNPTFPIAAETCVELILCLFLALYGMEEFNSLRNELVSMPSNRRLQPLVAALAKIRDLHRPAYVADD